MILCPNCGAPAMLSIGSVAPSKMYEKLTEEISTRCFCTVNDNDLEKMFKDVEESFEALVKEHYPQANKEEFLHILHNMDRDDPMRAFFVVRMGFLSRIREERQKRKIRQKQVDRYKEAKEEEKKNISGLKRIDTLLGE